MAEHVGQLESVALDTGPFVRRRQQHHGGDDEPEHEHDDQQGDDDAPPVALVGVARHQLLCTRVRRKRKGKQPSITRVSFAFQISNASRLIYMRLFLIGHLCVCIVYACKYKNSLFIDSAASVGDETEFIGMDCSRSSANQM